MAINIKLSDKFTMRSNIHCLQLCKVGIAGPDAKNAGEAIETSIADLTSFDSFFRSYVQHSLLNATDKNGDDITNFADLMEQMNKVLDQIRSIFNFSDLIAGKTTKECMAMLETEDPKETPALFKKLRKRKSE